MPMSVCVFVLLLRICAFYISKCLALNGTEKDCNSGSVHTWKKKTKCEMMDVVHWLCQPFACQSEPLTNTMPVILTPLHRLTDPSVEDEDTDFAERELGRAFI